MENKNFKKRNLLMKKVLPTRFIKKLFIFDLTTIILIKWKAEEAILVIIVIKL